MLTPIQTEILADLRAIWKPTPRQSVTEWSEQNLVLTSRQTEHPGPYSTANRPYVREPLECWHDPSVTDVVLCWGSQTSKTTTLMAGLCWVIDNEPSPVLWLMPTELLARSFSRTRWMPFLEESDVMRRHFPDDRKKITLLEQHFDRCTLTFVGSNSPANLASRPIRILVADEVDKFAAATSREAAALELALQRTKSYSSSKHFLTSTPTTLEGEIWQHFLQGDQRRFFIPCPHCERPIKLLWPQVKWDPQAKDESGAWHLGRVRASAHYQCQECAGHISDAQKVVAVRKGLWRPENPNAIPGVRSYHLSSLYSPDRKCTWGNLAVAFIQARESLLGLQGFINGDLAEPWENQDSRMERLELIAPPDAPPPAEAVPILTVDCQAVSPYFWFVVRAWGPEGHSRLVSYGHRDTWEEIREAQLTHGVTDNHVGIDSGHAAADVYAHCLRWGRIVPSRQPGLLPLHVGWTPMKGRERDASWKDPKTKQPRPYWLGSAALPHRKFRLPLLEFNGDFMLDILTKLRKGPEGAGGFQWELTDQADEEYFRHLNAKVRKPQVIGRSGKVHVIWRLRSGHWPDHLLDCELEQLAMAMIHRRLPWAAIAAPEREEETA
ncbi:MAG TPA: phage terminase large subunit family protein [Candidatus Paceibacterota bacterium]|nr:phage terminase large subunit family protein [Candidatus Paceibacterota bacterium]